MTEQLNDLLQARAEAALLLRLDPSNLSPSDTLRCDLIASLRLVVDDATASVLDGRGPDLNRLIVATETLIRLLPQTTSEPVDRREGGSNDPRRIMFETYMGMRKRGELADPTSTYEGQRRRIAELEAKVAELKAGAPASDEPSATPPAPAAPADNVVPLKPAAAAPAAPEEEYEEVVVTEAALGQPEPWRSYISSDGSIMTPGRKFWGPV